MKARAGKVRIGIVGCGAIGSRIARSAERDLGKNCQLTGLYDINQDQAKNLAKELHRQKIFQQAISGVINNCDIMVEAISAKNTHKLIRQALEARKSVLSMSVGKLLNAADLFTLARKNGCHLLLPSGAIAGIDAIKAASLAGIKTITLTTRKPISGFYGNPYLAKMGIDLSKIKGESTLFDGSASDALKIFPNNINVAATIALASHCPRKLKVRILTSPRYTANSHEIELTGKFGHIRTQTDNVVCPDNPKTSYLAVLSGLQTLKQFCSGVYIGT